MQRLKLPLALHEFVVVSREPSTEHRLTRDTFEAWLRRPGGSPAEVAIKTKLNDLLGGAPRLGRAPRRPPH